MSARAVLLPMLVLALAGGSAGCRPSDQETGSLDAAAAARKVEAMPAALRAQLDSGSAAFRARDLDAALAHYTAATRIDEGVAAAWFGIYMAQRAKGNAEEARAALERVQRLAPGATLARPSPGDTTR